MPQSFYIILFTFLSVAGPIATDFHYKNEKCFDVCLYMTFGNSFFNTCTCKRLERNHKIIVSQKEQLRIYRRYLTIKCF
jgi:hypothetical protein